MIAVVILVGVLAACLLFVLGVAALASVQARRRSILAGVEDEAPTTFAARLASWDRQFARTRLGAWVRRQLVLSGEEHRSPVVLTSVAVLLGVVVGWLLASLAPVFGVLGVGVAVLALRAWLARARERHVERFVSQMPELARVLSNSTGAGLSIASALAVAGAELTAPAGTELQRVANRVRFGADLDTAMKELEERLPSREVSVLVSTLLVASRSGGSLVTALRDIADTLDDRKETRREVRTTLAQATVTGYIVIGMGISILFLLNVIQAGTVRAMTEHWMGQIALVVSGGLFLTGFVAIRKMTRFDG